MEPFVLKTLKRLKKESPRRFKDLRIICDELIGCGALLSYLLFLHFLNIMYEIMKNSCTYRKRKG
jgi:hypothetical protein